MCELNAASENVPARGVSFVRIFVGYWWSFLT
jgi:hypothetical protein